MVSRTDSIPFTYFICRNIAQTWYLALIGVRSVSPLQALTLRETTNVALVRFSPAGTQELHSESGKEHLPLLLEVVLGVSIPIQAGNSD